jgi:tRNA G18 (ribose-2'-O)-methylase SpoU
MPERELGQFEKLCLQRNETITAFTAPKSVLEKLTGFQLYRGILALAKVPKNFSLAEIIEGSVPPLLLVAIDGVTNAENLGTMIRNAVAFGAHGLLLSHSSAPAYLRRAVRASMGAIFKLRHLQTEHLAQTLRDVANAGINVIAAHPHSDSYLPSVDLTAPACLVFGSEGDGVSADVLNACSKQIAIPMRHGTDSLNVASASAAFLYEVQRQRTAA